MKVDQVREGLYRMTVTTHELSLLLAAARMCLTVLEGDEGASAEARSELQVVVDDVDRALRRVQAAGKERGD